MGQKKITIVECEDLGPVLARADHQANAIEVNGRAFYALPPMVQEFVLCHEVCHLRHNEWDEGRTNRLAANLFVGRATTDEARKERQQFVSYLYADGYDNFAWGALISAVASLGTAVYGAVKNQMAGWYSWDEATRKANLNTMLRAAFEGSRRSSSQSAAELFWVQMQTYTNRDSSLEQFMGRSTNAWVQPVVAKYEKAYGFGFEEVTPIDLTAYPLVIVAIGAAVALLIYWIIKKRKK